MYAVLGLRSKARLDQPTALFGRGETGRSGFWASDVGAGLMPHGKRIVRMNCSFLVPDVSLSSQENGKLGEMTPVRALKWLNKCIPAVLTRLPVSSRSPLQSVNNGQLILRALLSKNQG